jgi:hypothetical protein
VPLNNKTWSVFLVAYASGQYKLVKQALNEMIGVE